MLGILGGMGPLATADFMRKLVLATPSKNDQNHIPVVVWSVPQIADRSEHIINGAENPFPMLLKGMNELKNAGACVAVIVCNTAHYWADELSEEVGVTILNIADAVANHVQGTLPQGGKVGLLATEGTVKSNIYQGRLDPNLWEMLIPTEVEQDELMLGIRSVKSGDVEKGQSIFKQQIQSLKDRGAEIIILGCTELPSVIEQDSSLIDSNVVLAHRCVDWYRANFGLSVID